MTLYITASRANENTIQIVNTHNREVGLFQDSRYESENAASILEFIEILKNEGIVLPITIVDKRKL